MFLKSFEIVSILVKTSIKFWYHSFLVYKDYFTIPTFKSVALIVRNLGEIECTCFNILQI